MNGHLQTFRAVGRRAGTQADVGHLDFNKVTEEVDRHVHQRNFFLASRGERQHVDQSWHGSEECAAEPAQHRIKGNFSPNIGRECTLDTAD